MRADRGHLKAARAEIKRHAPMPPDAEIPTAILLAGSVFIAGVAVIAEIGR